MNDQRPAGTPGSLESSAATDNDSARTAPPREQLLLQQAGDVIENLRSQMAELERREQNLATQTAALENESRRLRLTVQEFEEQSQQREESLKLAESSLAERAASLDQMQERLQKERAEFEADVEIRQQQFAAGLRDIDDELAAERATRRAAMEKELEDLASEVQIERSRWKEEQDSLRAEFDTEAVRLRSELENLQAELEMVRTEKLADVEQREASIQRREVELEKRTRLHENHLRQLRRSFEAQQTEFGQQQQQIRLRQVDMSEQLDRRWLHLVRVRDRLTQREESIDRERHLIDELRRTILHRAEEQEARWAQDRTCWEDECEAHRADIRRQQDMLALHAQNLEARRSRLDQLRDELEQTHRETLELRVAVEQVWTELADTMGEEAARERVEQARAELVSAFDHFEGSLGRQHAEIRAAEQRLTEQRERFRAEREEFTQWMSRRELQLQEREELLQRDVRVASEHEADWRRTRERWTLEKIEAESVIRQLLDELDADLARSDPADSRADGLDSGDCGSVAA